MFDYEEGPRVSYSMEGNGVAQFVRVCPCCGRFVKADDPLTVQVNGLDEVRMPETNATCSKCGRVAMPFEGFM